MNQQNPYQTYGFAPKSVAHSDADTRADFIRKTYIHLGFAIFAFIGMCALLMKFGVAEKMVSALSTTQWGWLVFMLGFMAVAGACEYWAHRTVSLGSQYAALAIYVFLEALFFAPFLFVIETMIEAKTGPIIAPAAIITLVIFAGLTAIVFYTARDFSWLRGALFVGGFAALGLMLASVIFGFQLGIVFIVAMIALASGYILYYTSNIMKHYPTTHYVAGALSLFACVALLFWYVLQLLIALTSD